MTYTTGAVYEGSWAYGKRNGEGKSSDSGNVYEGSWVNDLRQGNGTQGLILFGVRLQHFPLTSFFQYIPMVANMLAFGTRTR